VRWRRWGSRAIRGESSTSPMHARMLRAVCLGSGLRKQLHPVAPLAGRGPRTNVLLQGVIGIRLGRANASATRRLGSNLARLRKPPEEVVRAGRSSRRKRSSIPRIVKPPRLGLHGQTEMSAVGRKKEKLVHLPASPRKIVGENALRWYHIPGPPTICDLGSRAIMFRMQEAGDRGVIIDHFHPIGLAFALAFALVYQPGILFPHQLFHYSAQQRRRPGLVSFGREFIKHLLRAPTAQAADFGPTESVPSRAPCGRSLTAGRPYWRRPLILGY